MGAGGDDIGWSLAEGIAGRRGLVGRTWYESREVEIEGEIEYEGRAEGYGGEKRSCNNRSHPIGIASEKNKIWGVEA